MTTFTYPATGFSVYDSDRPGAALRFAVTTTGAPVFSTVLPTDPDATTGGVPFRASVTGDEGYMVEIRGGLIVLGNTDGTNPTASGLKFTTGAAEFWFDCTNVAPT